MKEDGPEFEWQNFGCEIYLYSTWRKSCSDSQSVNQSDSQSVSQSISQSVSQSVNQSISQPVSQSISQSVSQSVSHLTILVFTASNVVLFANREALVANGVTN